MYMMVTGGIHSSALISIDIFILVCLSPSLNSASCVGQEPKDWGHA